MTIMDFAVYEIVNYLEKLYPIEIQKFNKIRALRARFSQLPEIISYENSQRAVTSICPVQYFNEFKEGKQKNNKLNSSVSSTNSKDSSQHGMDLE